MTDDLKQRLRDPSVFVVSKKEAADRIEELEAKLSDAAAALKEIFDGKNWRLGQKFDPNSGNFDLSTQRKAYIKIKGEQP